MSRRVNTGGGKQNRRWNTILWIAALTVVTIALIYFEQTALLYILATLGVTALLIVVAMANLKGAEQDVTETGLGNDAAAIGSGIQSTLAGAASTTRAGAPRASKRR